MVAHPPKVQPATKTPTLESKTSIACQAPVSALALIIHIHFAKPQRNPLLHPLHSIQETPGNQAENNHENHSSPNPAGPLTPPPLPAPTLSSPEFEFGLW